MIPILEVASPTGTFRVRLQKGDMRFGRATDCDIYVRDKLVSGRHAVFTLGEDGAVRLRDLGSTNGVFVNGVRRSETALNNGDTIRAGSTIIAFAEEVESEVGQSTHLELAVVEAKQDETGFDPFSITVGVDEIAADLGSRPNTAGAASNALLVARTRLSLLYRLGQGATLDAGLDPLLTHIAQVVREGIGPERIAILVSEREGSPAIRRFARNWRRTGESDQVYVPRLVVATAMYERKVVLYHDLVRDPRFRDEPRLQEIQVRQAMAAPIVYGGAVRGAIYADRASIEPPFTAEELYLLGIVAYQSGAFLQNQEMFSRERAALDELRMTQDDLIRAAKLATIGELLAGVANEINNPVAAILGYSELAAASPACPEPLRRDIGEIHKASLRVKGILDELLAFCRRQPTQGASFEVEKTLREMLSLVEHDLRQKGVALALDFLPGIPPVAGDGGQIQQVVHTLVKRAEAVLEGQKGAQIGIRARCDHARCRVIVEDNGPPIPPDALAKLFDPYLAPNPQGLGRGLGLAIAAAIVKQHGGHIDVASGPAPGTRVTIDLPLKRGAPVRADQTATSIPPLPKEMLDAARAMARAGVEGAPGPGPAPSAIEANPPRRRVLVCDDEAPLRDLMFRALSKEGYEVLQASSGEEALERLQRETVDAVVTDLHLGGLDGLGLAERVSAIRPALERRFIFVTGDTASDAYRRLLDRGAEVIAKPFDLATLRARVARCLAAAPPIAGT